MVDVGGIVWLVLEFISMGNSYCPIGIKTRSKDPED